MFRRTLEGLRPTAVAERLRPLAERMEVDALALTQATYASQQAVIGVVRVATTDALATMLVAEGLLGVREQHPDLVIDIDAGNRSVDIARGEADIAVRLVAVREASLRARCLARFGVGLFCSPAYARARGIARSRAALSGHDVLVPAGELARLPESKWLESVPGVRVVFRSSSMPALLNAATAGLGLVPLGLQWGDRSPGLERMFVLDHIPTRPIWLVTRAGEGKRSAVRVVADRIASIFARWSPGPG